MERFLFAAVLVGTTAATAKAECNLDYVKANAIFIHATVECSKNYMDSPAGYYALAMARQCAALGESKFMPIAKQAMLDFDKTAKLRGKKTACAMADNLARAVRRDATAR